LGQGHPHRWREGGLTEYIRVGGYGDMTPLGAMRLLAGTEVLMGFVLIAWFAR
jgi:hypothetical protein